MVLVIGGVFQGKLDYVLKSRKMSFRDVCDCADNNGLISKKIIYHLEDYIRRSDDSAERIAEKIFRDHNCSIIICSEVGSGVIPVSKEENDFREKTGRTLCILAEQAVTVERVTAGIPIRIK